MDPRQPSPPPPRCPWAQGDALYHRYHDEDWGVPVVSDAKLFECLTLEGAQAGLSWRTILNKRDGYRREFKDFDPRVVARMGSAAVERLTVEASIVRHRGKIESTLKNARCVLEVQREFGSLARWIWTFAGGRPRQNRFERVADLPSQTEESNALSRALKRRGFSFVGPTTCYAFMQATGMVNDHLLGCFRHAAVARMTVDLPS